MLKRDKIDFLWAGLLPLLGIFIIFGPTLLNRESLYLGIIQEQYFLLGQFSFDHLIRSELSQGFFPLWNPNNALGTPLLGNMLSAVFYPLKFFLYLFPTLWAYELYTLFRFWLAGFCSYLLARKLGLSKAGSAFVLFGFSFSGYFQFFLNENYLNADFLLPVLILLSLYLSRSQNKGWVLALSFALFCLFNSGHPEAILYNWLFLLLSFLGFMLSLEKKERRGSAFRFILANLLGLFLSLPLVLSFLEFWVRGYHFHLPGAGLYHYSAKEFLGLFSPWFFGPSSPGAPFFHKPELSQSLLHNIFDYQSSSLPWLVPSLGMIFLPLLILIFLELKKLPPLYFLWLSWLLIFLGLSFGLPIFQFLGLVWPLNLSGNFKHPLPALILSAVIPSALMLEKFFAGKISPKKFLYALLLSLFCLLLFFPYPDFKRALNSELALELSVVVLFLLWTSFAGAGKTPGSPLYAPFGFGLGIILLLLAAELRNFWQKPIYLKYHLAELKANPIFQQLKKDPSLPRFYFERELFPPNLNLLLEVPDLRIMDGVNHRALVGLVNSINGHTREEGFRYWYHQVGYLEVMPEKIEEPILDLTGLKYVISRSPLPYHRTPERILETGKKISPSPSHLGIAYFPLGNATAKTLFQHPPSRISFHRCALYSPENLPKFCQNLNPPLEPELPPSFLISFSPRIQKSAWEKEPDGVWFMIQRDQEIFYCRYLHPKKHPEEKELPFTELQLKKEEERLGTSSTSLITLPAGNSDFDWTGWLDLRIEVPRETEKLKLLSDNNFWFYQNPNALTRLFLAEPGEYEGGETKSTLKQRHKLVMLKEQIKPSAGTEKSECAEVELKLCSFSSQSYELKFESPKECWLVFSQILFPGWKALLDGAEQRLVPADFLTALKISPGKHQLKIFYQPWAFRIGLYFSLSTMIALLVLGILRKRS